MIPSLFCTLHRQFPLCSFLCCPWKKTVNDKMPTRLNMKICIFYASLAFKATIDLPVRAHYGPCMRGLSLFMGAVRHPVTMPHASFFLRILAGVHLPKSGKVLARVKGMQFPYQLPLWPVRGHNGSAGSLLFYGRVLHKATHVHMRDLHCAFQHVKHAIF